MGAGPGPHALAGVCSARADALCGAAGGTHGPARSLGTGRGRTRPGGGSHWGNPDQGKTRLFHEFTHASRTRGWLLLESSSTSYGKATPYLPVIDLLKPTFQIEDHDDGRRMREKLTGRLLTLDRPSGQPCPPF